MILGNSAILEAIQNGWIGIDPFPYSDPTKEPFNTSAVDLTLGDEIVVPDSNASAILDLRSGSIADFWSKHSTRHKITADRPYTLTNGTFILARTKERVSFPLNTCQDHCYSARVEGKSSLARCGILVHFTAPTIHAGFEGTITLEIILHGPLKFNLVPDIPICQLIIEQVKGSVHDAPNQFKGQRSATGEK